MKLELITLSLAVASPPILASSECHIPKRTPRVPSPLLLQDRRPFGILPNVLSLRGGEVHESQTLEDLDSLIQSAALNDKLTVIDFTATWCGPCKMIAPVFHALSDEHGSRAQFVKVDVDDNPEAAQKYGVSAMPTFVFVKGGEVVDRLMGANGDRLKELIEEWSF